MKTNEFELSGFVGNTPDVRFTPNGKTVATFSLYTKERWTDSGGEQREKTQRHQITAWGHRPSSPSSGCARAPASRSSGGSTSSRGVRASSASTRPSWSPMRSC